MVAIYRIAHRPTQLNAGQERVKEQEGSSKLEKQAI